MLSYTTMDGVIVCARPVPVCFVRYPRTLVQLYITHLRRTDEQMRGKQNKTRNGQYRRHKDTQLHTGTGCTCVWCDAKGNFFYYHLCAAVVIGAAVAATAASAIHRVYNEMYARKCVYAYIWLNKKILAIRVGIRVSASL